MIFEHAEPFRKDFAGLPDTIKKKASKALVLFEADPRHPSLRVEKIDSARDIWSARVDRNYRLTFQWIPGGIRLRRIGSHQTAYPRLDRRKIEKYRKLFAPAAKYIAQRAGVFARTAFGARKPA